MADYVNVSGSYSGTTGNDIFSYNGAFPAAMADALDGFDRVTIDAAGTYVTGLGVRSAGNGTFTVEALRPHQLSATFQNVETATLLGTEQNDNFGLSLTADTVGLTVDFDGRAGTDRLFLDYRIAGPLTFVATGNGPLVNSFGTFANIENFTIQSDATSNTIALGGGTDMILAAGTLDIASGGGNDDIEIGRLVGSNIVASAASGTIDGGDGADQLRATFSNGATPISLTFDAATLSTGTGLTVSNVEFFTLKTGVADDTVTMTADRAAQIDGREGADSFTYDVSGTTNDQLYIVSPYVTDGQFSGHAGTVSFFSMEHVTLRAGSGADTFQISGATSQAGLVLDGGSGFDVLKADFSTQSDSSSVIVAGGGSITSNRGQFSAFERFELRGGSGADTFTTGAGDDLLDGGTGDDVLAGGAGNDNYVVRSSNAQVTEAADAGTDLVTAYASFTLSANIEDLTLKGDGVTPIDGTGNESANVITGTNGVNVLRGMGGDDRLIGGAGGDQLDGGAGSDTADYQASSGAVNINLATASANGGFAQGDTLTSIENLLGSSFGDTLVGNDAANRLEGFEANDILTGGLGTDTLTGGIGADTFRDTAAGLNGDTITDFSVGDKIVITDASIAGFSVSVSGNTLTYSGGSLTLSAAATRPLVVTANGSGGVDIALARAVRNDFNGDGRSDILWRNTNGQLSDWLANANGGFAQNDANAFTSVPTNWQVVGTGDFNGDGRSDILWRNANGQLSDWLGQANGGFAQNDANALTGAPTSWHVVGTGDFNGDGRDDILWRNDNGQLSDWLGQADGGFAQNDANALTSVPTSWKVAGTGDFNGDGRDDIVWRNDNGQLSTWLANANGGFAQNDANALTGAPTSWHVVGTGDFNGDGRDDIVWRNDNGQLSNWLGQANGGFAQNDANALSSAPTNWRIVDTGDYNGDGRDDILWRSDSGQLSNWLANANGGFAQNDTNAFNSAPTSWTTQPVHDFIL